MKARALVHDVYVKCDMNAMLRLGAIATVRTWSTLGELKRGIDHPCFGMTRGEADNDIWADGNNIAWLYI